MALKWIQTGKNSHCLFDETGTARSRVTSDQGRWAIELFRIDSRLPVHVLATRPLNLDDAKDLALGTYRRLKG